MRARDNPFATRHLEAIGYRFPDGDSLDALLRRLELHQWRGAMVGPHGSGKSNLLEQLEPHLRSRGFEPILVRFTADTTAAAKRHALQHLCPTRFLLLDGAEQLSLWPWWRLRRRLRRAPGLLVTQHRPGRLPTVLRCQTSPALLTALAVHLTGTPPADPITLFQRHRGNLRDCLRELYDRWSG